LKKALWDQKAKKPEPEIHRFGLSCPAPDWQHWQSATKDWQRFLVEAKCDVSPLSIKCDYVLIDKLSRFVQHD